MSRSPYRFFPILPRFEGAVKLLSKGILSASLSYAFPTAPSIGGEPMKECLCKRACELAVYMIETGATVRSAARHFGISKSTVHKDLTQRLRQCNPSLYAQAREVLDENKQERHIRGGMATKRKYERLH